MNAKLRLVLHLIYIAPFGRNLLTKSRNARFTALPIGHFRFSRLTIASHKTNYIIGQLLQIVSPRPFYYVTFLIKLSWQLITRLFVWIISPIQILMHLSFASLGNPRELKGNGTVSWYFFFQILILCCGCSYFPMGRSYLLLIWYLLPRGFDWFCFSRKAIARGCPGGRPTG